MNSGNVLHDIESKADVKLLVDSFYAKALIDPLIRPVFTDIAKINLSEHLPHLYAFWEMLILGSNGYTRQPFPPHIPLGLKEEHFDRWLGLFEQTLDENFLGVNACSALQKARNIARLFLHKLSIM